MKIGEWIETIRNMIAFQKDQDDAETMTSNRNLSADRSQFNSNLVNVTSAYPMGVSGMQFIPVD
jgi:hypothetical protein